MAQARTAGGRRASVFGLAMVFACAGDDAAPGVADGSGGTSTSSSGGEVSSATSADPSTSAADTTAGSESGGDSSHVLGGMVQGLQGATVEIVNGAETLALDTDGPFTFPTRLDSGDGYAVEVSVQPSGPDQTCTVVAGDGVVAEADIDDIIVRCVTPIRHVIVLGIDGLGGDWLAPIDTPALDALRAEGVWTPQMQNVLPTSSSTNWMSMIDGTTPQQHGVLSNGWQPGDSNPPPTMFAALRQQRPDATIGIFHDWADFDRLVEPGIADHVEHPGDEQETMTAAIAWMQREQPTLLFIHLDHVDHAGHLSTWGSAPYVAAVEDADTLTGQLRTAVEDAGMWPYTAVIVSSDHGGTAFSHGSDTAAERTIPFILRAPQSTPGLLERDVRIWDIAATVLALLDVPAPPEWVASPVVEGLFDRTATLPPPLEEGMAVAVDQHVLLY
ncbi:MAG: alkaline phosphatase family protein, partial [Deltaproteobacteria bacterium]|nr:alkaline phosphatase family protein [Deltaproteobacteria bacterium]